MDALLLSKNVIVLADVFYKNFSGAFPCDNIPKISNLLNNKEIYVIDNGMGNLAVEDLCEAFDNGLIPNSLEDEMYFNIKRMNNLELS